LLGFCGWSSRGYRSLMFFALHLNETVTFR
jgi:hypothetical protein